MSKTPKKTFRVYLAQINQTYYEIEAADKDEARIKAARQWLLDNGPIVISIEEQGGGV